MKSLVRHASCALFAAVAALAAATTAADTGEAQFLDNTRQLILEGNRSGEGYFSPDGKHLIFQSEREPGNPFYQIYILDFDSGDIHRVSPGIGKTTCSFFQPGTDRVLFASTHLDPQAKQKQDEELALRASGKTRRYAWNYDDQMDIFSANRDGSKIRRLTTAPGYDAEGAFSPDGRKIVFTSLRSAYPPDKLSPEDRGKFDADPSYFGDIYIMDADGSHQKRLTSTPGYDGGPFFSPDGKRIIWRHFSSDTIADIYTMKTDGSDVRRITDFGVMSWSPYYHPSGRYIIFASNKLGFSNFELYITDVEGKHEPVRVTYSDGFDSLPVFSPDGKKLSWTSSRGADHKSQIFIADWNDAAARAAIEQSPLRAASSATTALPAAAPVSAAITARDLHTHVAYLADDALQGRMTGSPGAALAAQYITDRMKQAGLKPLNGDSFLQPFEFSAGVKVIPDQNRLAMAAGGASREFRVEQDFRPLSFSANGGADGEVVFAGYGLSVPGENGKGYDSYAGLDVKDKIVLVLRYVPENVSPPRRAELNRYAGLRYKAMIARNHGAKALLVVTGPNSPNPGELSPLAFDSSLAGSGIVAASISGDAAAGLLAPSGKDLKTLQTALDDENPQAVDVRFTLPATKISLTTALEHLKKTDNNVIGWLPPAIGKSPEFVMLGAHYDHLGLGETGSLAVKGEEHQIHSGADDNASGVATVLEIAAALAAERKAHPEKFPRGVAFALWSGEELGLIGSANYAEHPLLPLTDEIAYINFDMVGRLRENRLMLQGIGSSSAWRTLIEKRNVPAGFNVVLQDDPYLPTDTTSFYPKNVPVLAFFTGSHENYHRPTDKTDTLNYEGMARVAQFAEQITLDLVRNPQRPDYLKVAKTQPALGGRESLRAYLGTIPDYAAEVQGVRLSGARGGSPADKAGFQAGDVIVEFAGQKIANIYDYTYALDAVKIGVPVKVVVLRDGRRVEITVTPEPRPGN
ncbi:MAG TPA: M28 family peptidase [Burkholderiales bacterium]|nr:M28 family peptidase [Burkholderiales bacterium]